MSSPSSGRTLLIFGGDSGSQVIGETGISAPKSALSNKIIDIPYNEVTNILDQKVQKQVFLAIHGKASKVTIAQSALASKEQFQEMRSNLIERVEQR